jgi:hypothetical protein
MPQRFQIDVTTGNAVDAEDDDDDERTVDAGGDRNGTERCHPVENTDGDPEEVAVLRQIFRPNFRTVETSDDTAFGAPTSPISTHEANDNKEDKLCHEEKDDVEPWNYPVSTFDTLGSEDRHYVRAKSKQTGEMLERDDHFFASAPFVDCVVQCERSRRLTVRAVDLLALQSGSSVVTHQSDVATSERAATLADTLNAKFNREKERETFEVKIAQKGFHGGVKGKTNNPHMDTVASDGISKEVRGCQRRDQDPVVFVVHSEHAFIWQLC